MRSRPRPLDLVLTVVVLSCGLSGLRWQSAGSRDLSPVGEERRYDVCPIRLSFDRVLLAGVIFIDANHKLQIFGHSMAPLSSPQPHESGPGFGELLGVKQLITLLQTL